MVIINTLTNNVNTETSFPFLQDIDSATIHAHTHTCMHINQNRTKKMFEKIH